MGKKNKRKKKEEDDNEDSGGGLSQETKNGIWGILSFGLAVLAVLAFFGKAGTFGELFSSVSKAFFGWGIFLIPTAFLILGASFIKSFEKKVYKSATIGTTLFVLSFLGIFNILAKGEWSLSINQGGYLGLALGYPLFKSVGFLSSFIILAVMIFVAFLVALDIPFHKVIFRTKKESEDGDEETDGAEDSIEDKGIVIRHGARVLSKEELREAERPQAKTALKSEAKKEEDGFVIKTSKSGKWVTPPLDLLHSDKDQPRFGDINANAAIIKRTLGNFGIDVEMGEVSVGPTVTQFTLRPAIGVKLASITGLKSDLSLALAAHPLRVE